MLRTVEKMQGPKQVPGKNEQSARELERQQRGRNINRRSNWKEAASTESVRAEDSGGTLTFNGVISCYLLTQLCKRSNSKTAS